MKITGQTTLAELETERARLGIERSLVILKEGPLKIEITIISSDGMLRAEGETLADAHDNAFRLREKQIAALCERPFRLF